MVYSNREIDANRKVSLRKKSDNVSAYLDEAFAGTDIGYDFENNYIVLMKKANRNASTVAEMIRSAQQQGKTITGKVTDINGEPIIGATILIKGTSQGTVTDIDGNYTLTNVPEDATLVFSFVGMESQEISIDGKTVINVTMKEAIELLEELVVVGYGVQKKVDMTGSVSFIDGDVLLKAPTPNLTNALTGKMTGVITTQQSGKPGFDDPVFYIRGKSTFGDSSPLLLVDGIERSISKLDPNEIESVTILKDAASAAVYGARAANGVIIVTTKRGKEGKPRINYSGSFGFQTPTVIPKMMNAYEYAKYLNVAKVNFGDIPRFTESEIQSYKNGIFPTTDWWRETLKNKAGIQQHSFTSNGGNEFSKYFLSLGYLNQDGLYDLSGFKRYTVRSNIDTKITKDFSVSLDLAGRYEKLRQSAVGDGLFSTIINSKPTERAYVPDSIKKGGLGSNGQNVSPIGQAERSGYNKTDNSVFQSILQGIYDIPFLKGLQVKGRFSYDRWFSKAKTFTTPYEFYKYDREINLYTKQISGGGINLYEGTAEDERITLQTSLTYDATFNGSHNVSALLLHEESSYKYSNLQASRVNYISSAIDQLFAGPDKDKSNNGSANENVRRGYVGRLNYTYQGKYLFQYNFRYDGSYNFPKNKRWGFFPAVSAGWRISEEPFLKNNSVLHNLKLRGSYGKFGNDRVPPFQYMSGYKFNSGAVIGGNFQSGLTNTGIANPNITWETASNMDIGVDFGLLQGKISGEFTYFYKKTRDILLPRYASIPQTFGATLPDENIGKVDNKGIEAIFSYNERFRDLNLMVNSNITFAKSKIVFMDEPVDVEDRIRVTGRPFDQFFGLRAMGLFRTQEEIDNWAIQDGHDNSSIKVGDIKYHDYDNNGVIDGKDIQMIGKSQIPEIIFGLNIGLSYKKFDLTMFFQGATGFNQYLRWDPFNLESNALAVFKDSWTEDNPDAKYPCLYAGAKQNNREKSSFWLYDGTYLRLRNFELAYTFDEMNFLTRVGIQNLRIFISGNNLLTFSRMKDFDPEAPNIDPDRNSYYYPQMGTFNYGFSVEF